MTNNRPVVVPTTSLEANASLRRIGDLDRAIADIELSLEARIAILRAQAVNKAAALVAEREDRIEGIRQYASVYRAVILKDGKKCVELPAGVFGWRFTPPKVSLARGGEKRAFEILKRLQLTRYIRTKESLDRELLLRDRPVINGINYTQREEFYVTATPATEPEAIENVVILARFQR